MKFLSLERLVGPGKSLDENFEIMNLALIKAYLPHHKSFRLSAPDGGIDIYSRATTDGDLNHAFQCKAYSTFKSNLLPSVTNSVLHARSSAKKYPWDQYTLIIPFVPTSNQRTKLEEALDLRRYRWRHQSKEMADQVISTLDGGSLRFTIVDGDELEATLFRYPSVARRFFPSVIVVTPFEQGRITLGFPDDPTMLEINLRVYTWNQTMLVNVSPTAKGGSLLQMLIGQLTLPIKGAIAVFRGGKTYYDIKWELFLEGDTERILDLEKTLPEQNVTSGATISLRYSISVKVNEAFFGGSKVGAVELFSFFDHKIYLISKESNDNGYSLTYWLNSVLKNCESIKKLVLKQ